MDVTDVMDDETECKGFLVGFLGEPFLELSKVDVIGIDLLALEEGNTGGNGVDDVGLSGVDEVGEISCIGASIRVVWLVDEMPVALSLVTLTLDIVSEGTAFGEWVSVLVVSDGRVRLLEDGELVNGHLVSTGAG